VQDRMAELRTSMVFSEGPAHVCEEAHGCALGFARSPTLRASAAALVRSRAGFHVPARDAAVAALGVDDSK